MPIEVIVIILFLYAVGWLRQQAEKQKRRQALPPRPQRSRSPADPTDEADPSSRPARDILPDELWREIEALARGEPSRTEVPEPPPVAAESKPAPASQETRPPHRSVEPRPLRSPERESELWREGRELVVRSPAPREVIEGAVVAESKPGAAEPRISVAGTPGAVSGAPLPARLASVTDAALTTRIGTDREDAPPTLQSFADAHAAEWLVGASPEDLRKAVILHAVLGPPLGLRRQDRTGQGGRRADSPEEPTAAD